MLNAILRLRYQKSIFPYPSLLFAQNFQSVQWVSESSERGINHCISSIVWGQGGNERGLMSPLI